MSLVVFSLGLMCQGKNILNDSYIDKISKTNILVYLYSFICITTCLFTSPKAELDTITKASNQRKAALNFHDLMPL